MSSSSGWLAGPGGRVVLWLLFASAACCLVGLGLVSANLVLVDAGRAPVVPGFQPSMIIVYALAGVGLGVLAIAAVLIGEVSARTGVPREEADRQQRDHKAILRLLDEMGALSDGDLTARATVTEDVTGSIAEAVNDTIAALRGLVATVDTTAEQIGIASDELLAAARELTATSRTQNEQIASAAEAMQELAAGNDSVSNQARRAAEVTDQALTTARAGSEAASKTSTGIDSARDRIREAAGIVERLGKSSGEIGDIVELLNDISEQTNTLALNASIQEAQAGDSGRGFGVLADEVQRLAERASTSTYRVDGLVRAIRADCNEALEAMEASTNGVANGAQLAENASHALAGIDEVVGQMSELVRGISTEAERQRTKAQQLAATVDELRGNTRLSETGAETSARKTEELAELGSRLRDSVSGFTLPDRAD